MSNFSKHRISIVFDWATYLKISSYESDIDYDYLVDSANNLGYLERGSSVRLTLFFKTDIDKNIFLIKYPEIALDSLHI